MIVNGARTGVEGWSEWAQTDADAAKPRINPSENRRLVIWSFGHIATGTRFAPNIEGEGLHVGGPSGI